MRINIKLDVDFEDALFDLLSKDRWQTNGAFAKLNGFSDSQLSYTDFIDNFIDHNVVADASIDSNANVGHKDIVSLMNEMKKPHSKLLSFNKIFYEIKKKYGLKTAREWLKAEWYGDFYMHDAFNTSFVSYCFAYDLEKVVNEGLFFMHPTARSTDNWEEYPVTTEEEKKYSNSRPPKHLTTYTDFVAEFTSWCCNRSSGAVGLPSFLVYSYYFWKKDVEDGFYQKSPEYYRDQEFQRIIYKLNQPYLREGIQSA